MDALRWEVGLHTGVQLLWCSHLESETWEGGSAGGVGGVGAQVKPEVIKMMGCELKGNSGVTQ